MYTVVRMDNGIQKDNKSMVMNKRQLEAALQDLLPFNTLKIEPHFVFKGLQADFLIEISVQSQSLSLVGEIMEGEKLSRFEQRIRHLKSILEDKPDMIPVVISKYFSPQKREICKKMEVNFLDFSGNAYLKHGNIYIDRIGFPNLFPERRRGRGIFSDKASLILRAMLSEGKLWGVRALASKIGLDPGYVSRVFKEMERKDYLIREKGKFRLKEPKILLEDWIHFYDYRKNRFDNYFCLSKSPGDIIERLWNLEILDNMEYALGFHAGANLVSPHAVFDSVHIYISNPDSMDYFVRALDLKSVERGANLIFVSPYYKHSVFYDRQRIKKLWVVSNIQLYLDLFKFPLRGIEQAEHIYDRYLKDLVER